MLRTGRGEAELMSVATEGGNLEQKKTKLSSLFF